MLAKLPLTLPGWHREQQVLRVPLLKRYRERADVPFAVFRATLQVCCASQLDFLVQSCVLLHFSTHNRCGCAIESVQQPALQQCHC